MRLNLVLRAIFYTITIPGIAALLLPYQILLWTGFSNYPEASSLQTFKLIIWFLFICMLLYCIWGFAFYGKGTLAPIDPPKELVVHGLYRYTRNPMYVAVMGILLSEAWFFGSLGILIYAVIAFILFNLFVVYYEEPKLLEQFGDSFKEYQRKVPRWLIRLKAAG